MDDDNKKAKLFFISSWFEKQENELSEVSTALSDNKFLPQWVVLMCCYIDAFSSLRYPNLDTNEAFKNLVLDYSEKKEFFSQIDIYFLYNIEDSRWSNKKPFRRLHSRQVIRRILEDNYDGVNISHNKNRYQKSTDVINTILKSKYSGIDERNIKCRMGDYSLVSILYHVIRCTAVHEVEVPVLNASYQPAEKNTGYKSNHLITPIVIKETMQNVIAQLKKECLDKCKWLWELN